MNRRSHIGLAVVGLALNLQAATTEADVVTVVSSKSAVTTLSKKQTADIFLGRSGRFPDVAQAVPIDQADASAVRDEFYNKVADKSRSQVKAHWSRVIFTGRGHPPAMVASSVELKKRLTENPLAIGNIDDSQVDASIRVVRAP